MKIVSFLILFLLILQTISFAQQNNFEQIFLQDGLSQSHVSDITQDKFGYMWFATHDGLNRYDGYNFTIFRHDPGDKTSIRGNWINNIYADQSGRIWARLGIGGMSVYNPQTNTFNHLNEKDSVHLINSNLIFDITEDPSGKIILATNSGLDIIPANIWSNPKSKIFSIKLNEEKNSNNDQTGFWRCQADSFNGVWALSFKNELIRFEINQDSITHKIVYNPENESNRESNSRIEQLFIHKGKSIWITNRSGKIRHFTIKANQEVIEEKSH